MKAQKTKLKEKKRTCTIRYIVHKAKDTVIKFMRALICIIAVLLGAVSPDVVNNARTPEEMDMLIEKEVFGKRSR